MLIEKPYSIGGARFIVKPGRGSEAFYLPIHMIYDTNNLTSIMIGTRNKFSF